MTKPQKRVILIFGAIVSIAFVFSAVKEIKLMIARGLAAVTMGEAILSSFIDTINVFLSVLGILVIVVLAIAYWANGPENSEKSK